MLQAAGTLRLLVLSTLLFCLGANAQWLNYREPGVPRLKNGKVDLSAPAPRSAGGKPDLTGTWMHEPTPPAELKRLFRGTPFEAENDLLPPGMNIELQTKYSLDILIDVDILSGFQPGQPPTALMKPEGIAVQRRLMVEMDKPHGDPCGAEGVGWPLAGLVSEPIKIIQAPQETIVLYEVGNLHRQIFTDGRKFPAEFELPSYLGYSVGRWEGDTFVVETRGFKEGTSLDSWGHPRSEAMHVTERFRRRDFGHLDTELTFDDPKFYTKPFTVRIPYELLPGDDVLEMFCENEKDAAHLKP